MRRIVIALVLLALFGAAKLPFENELTREHRAAYFHQANLNLSLRAEIGQFGFLAALSGFRALVADALWLEGHSAWEKTEWGRMAYLFNAVCALQPRNTMFWDMSAWHMAWNASVAALNNPHEPRANVRERAALQYYRLGEDILLRGIQNNPDRFQLFQSLGNLYKDKLNDHLKASDMYAKAAAFADSPTYEKRFAAYQLALVPGREHDAYEKLRALYDLGSQEWLPTLLESLTEMQAHLPDPLAPAAALAKRAEDYTKAIEHAESPEPYAPAQFNIIAFEGYELSLIPGREDAWRVLKKLYSLNHQEWPNALPRLLPRVAP